MGSQLPSSKHALEYIMTFLPLNFSISHTFKVNIVKSTNCTENNLFVNLVFKTRMAKMNLGEVVLHCELQLCAKYDRKYHFNVTVIEYVILKTFITGT